MEMFDEELISGTGSKGSTPVNQEDNLNSKATAKILDAVSEGEIAGFATPFEEEHLFGSSAYGIAGQKDIFFNKTPLLQPTAGLSPTADDYNFNTENLFLETKNGSEDQEIMVFY